GIRDFHVTGVQTCALPISVREAGPGRGENHGSRHRRGDRNGDRAEHEKQDKRDVLTFRSRTQTVDESVAANQNGDVGEDDGATRSEERRVGKEWRARGGPY